MAALKERQTEFILYPCDTTAYRGRVQSKYFGDVAEISAVCCGS
jgi:hypothetical protein